MAVTNTSSAAATQRTLPSLRVAVTGRCPMSCIYCPTSGEHRDVPTVYRRGWDARHMKRIVTVTSEMSVPSIRFTGGEPLLGVGEEPKVFERIPPLVEAAVGSNPSIEIRINTNGVNVEKRIQELVELHRMAKRNFKLAISIDSINSTEFQQFTGSNELENVIRGARLARDKGIPVIINMVLANLEKSERSPRPSHIELPRPIDRLYRMINFCIDEGFDLKLLDLNWYDRPGRIFWEGHYFSMTFALEKFLEAVEKEVLPKYVEGRIVREPGDYGIPMPTFWFESSHWKKQISITFKNSEFGTTYNPWCAENANCKLYPREGIIGAGVCQEGLYQPVLTTNRILTACKHKEIELALDLLCRRSEEDVREGAETIFNFFASSFLQTIINFTHMKRFPFVWEFMKQFYGELARTPGTNVFKATPNIVNGKIEFDSVRQEQQPEKTRIILVNADIGGKLKERRKQKEWTEELMKDFENYVKEFLKPLS